jgi:hypothetical protein
VDPDPAVVWIAGVIDERQVWVARDADPPSEQLRIGRRRLGVQLRQLVAVDENVEKMISTAPNQVDFNRQISINCD